MADADAPLALEAGVASGELRTVAPIKRCRTPTLLPGPITVKFIVLNELCERFCFYGARTLLVLYFNGPLGYSEPESISVVSFFMAGCYLTPLFGGYIADTFLGRFWTITSFNLSYLAGMLTLSLTAYANNATGSLVGLALIALGTGGIKPCISPFGADQLAGCTEVERISFFYMFYFSVNVGSLLSYIITPVVRDSHGYGAAFAVCFGMLAASLIVFLAASRRYVKQPASGVSVYATIFRVVKLAWKTSGSRSWDASAGGGADSEERPLIADSGRLPLSATAAAPHRSGIGASETGIELEASGAFKGDRHAITSPSGGNASTAASTRSKSWLDRARPSPGAVGNAVSDADVDGVLAVWRLMPLFLCLPLFWALYDSQATLWTLQRTQMDLRMGSVVLSPESFGVINPGLVLVMVPALEKLVLPCLRGLRDRTGWQLLGPTSLRLMGAGMQIAALAYVASAGVQAMIDTELAGRADPGDGVPTSVSVAWQIPQLVLITTAEVLVSATGLEFAYSQAPASMRGTILALFYLAVFLGDTLYGTMQSLPLTTLQSILMFACLMSAAGWIFSLLAWRYVPSRGTSTA